MTPEEYHGLKEQPRKSATRRLTPAEVKAIRDAVGGTEKLAERLEITERTARYFLRNGVSRRSTVSRPKALVAPKRRQPAGAPR
jgi:hypothetical protein